MPYLIALPITLLVLLSACQRGGVAGAEGAGRTMLWAEEFDGDRLDPDSWNFEYGDGCPNLCGWGNNERQWYTDENHRLEDGHLIITARKDGPRYTSTRITTRDKRTFKYGRIEGRMKLPAGAGLWPAFWMLGKNIDAKGWPACGEIDIMEYVGRRPGIVFTSLHTPAGSGGQATSEQTEVAALESDFHVYAAEWTRDSIVFFIDGKPVFTFAPENRSQEVWPFDQPFFILLNLAVGGNFGGPEVDDSIFPQEFIIDYVRVYAPQ